METLKDLVEEAKRRTILVAILVLIVAYIMSCMSTPHSKSDYSLRIISMPSVAPPVLEKC